MRTDKSGAPDAHRERPDASGQNEKSFVRRLFVVIMGLSPDSKEIAENPAPDFSEIRLFNTVNHMSSPEKQIYRFENVELDVSRNSLRREGQEQHLRRKAFQILAHLLKNRERLVTKDELIDKFWEDTAVTDDALVQCIKEIRRAIGDDSQRPRFIKTYPKSGYRFIGLLEDAAGDYREMEEAPEEDYYKFHSAESNYLLKETAPPVASVFQRSTSSVFAMSALILIAALTLFGVFGKNLWRTEAQPIEISMGESADGKSLAVMYFKNQSKSGDLEWLSEGIADMLITNLSRTPKLNILSRQQFHSLLERSNLRRGDEISFEQSVEIARKSKATNFILGSFAKAGEKIRLDVQLYDTQSGALLAAESLIADQPEQILTGIDLLSLRLAKQFNKGSLPDNRPSLVEAMTDNLEAYRYYSLGVELAQAMHNKEAIELLEKAAVLDPQFAMAYARIGYAYSISGNDPEKGKPYLEKAFRLSDRLTEKDRLTIAAWYAIANMDYPTAIQSYREIIARYPFETEAYSRLARLLYGERRFGEAIDTLKQGLIVDPEAKNLYNVLGSQLSMQSRHSEAIQAHQRYVALASNEPNAYDSLGLTYQWAGDYQAAINNYNHALELNRNFEITLIHLANARFQLGQYREAINLNRRYIEVAPSEIERIRGYEDISAVYLMKKDFGSSEKAAAEVSKRGRNNFWSKYLLAVERGDMLKAREIEKQNPEYFRQANRGARMTSRFELYLRGYFALKNGDSENALATFKDLLKAQPPTWSMNAYEDCLANAHLELGRFDEAIAEYERILQLNPNYPFARFHIAQAFERKGMNEEAARSYQKFLEIWKDADADIPEKITAQSFLRNDLPNSSEINSGE